MNYKATEKNGIAPITGFEWPLPKNGKPGKWVKAEGEIILCENGIHYCKDELQLLSWLNEEIWEIEVKGKKVISDDKCAARQGRLIRKLNTWNERTQRLFACDCTEHVLHIFEDKCPDDDRPRKAIETARRFAEGKATQKELVAAHRAASSAAYWATSSASYWAASSASSSAAYWAAYRAAYWAASSAAYRAEKKWQAKRLGMYLRGEL